MHSGQLFAKAHRSDLKFSGVGRFTRQDFNSYKLFVIVIVSVILSIHKLYLNFVKMENLLIGLWTLHSFQATAGLFSTIECLSSQSDVSQFNDNYNQPVDCTLLMFCKDSPTIDAHSPGELCPEEFQYRNDDFLFDCYQESGHGCSMKFTITMIGQLDVQSSLENPCSNLQDSSASKLLPVSGNCSLFYKCDWGSSILFQCPPELHFNSELQVCDWPWRAKCDSSWNGCPRPPPRCPANYPRPLYLPHSHLCDKFYQCNWGISHLQTCPMGLYFNAALQICDWPYKANCQVC